VRDSSTVHAGNYDGADMSSRSRRAEQWVAWMAALLGQVVVTAVLVNFSHQVQRDYVFIYLGLVAVVGVVRGLWPALVCAAMSFLLVDYFFAHQLGGEFTRLEGRNVAAMLAHYISETEATEVVIGHRRRARWRPWDTTNELIRRLAGVDVHILRVREPAV